MRLLPVALAVALVTSVITDSSPAIVAEPDDRAVEIATLACADDAQAASSGYVLDDELVVTVAHALFESRDFAVLDATGRWHQGTLIHLDLERDLALVRVSGLKAKPASVVAAADDDPVRMVAGAGSGSLSGTVVQRFNIEADVVGGQGTAIRKGYSLRLEIEPGDSGAGIVDASGDLVALVFAKSTRDLGRAWATSASEIVAVRDQMVVPTWDCAPGSAARLTLRAVRSETLAG